MMKNLIVRKIDVDGVTVQTLSAILDREQIPFQPIDQVNWEDYPYQPDASFRLATMDGVILINYRVTEDSVRAKYGEDNDSVWTDSCVELFVEPAGDGIYYNIECNCIGTVLVGMGKDRHDRVRASQKVMNGIQRWASLGNTPFEQRIGECAWEVSLIIPYAVFFAHNIESFKGEIKGNFYKCGDELETPHFISWNRIQTEKPNFHCPIYFGSLCFE